MRFIDSNVLVYSADPRDAAKQQIAKAIVMSARNSNDYVISAQAINEFANVALNKLGKENEDVQKFIWMFREIKTVDVRLAWSSRALEIMKRYGLQFYDSLLLAAAEALGCDEFLTEDLNDGQMYGSVKAINPFKQKRSDNPPKRTPHGPSAARNLHNWRMQVRRCFASPCGS